MATTFGQVIVRAKMPKMTQKGSARSRDKAAKKVAADLDALLQTRLNKPGRSNPGQYPGKQTGALRSGVSVTGTAKFLTIRSLFPHGVHLEHGTVNMAARPWASKVLAEKDWRKQVRKLANAAVPKGKRKKR